MAGPLVAVGTKTAAISLDISRKLNMGKGIVLSFIVPDPTEVTKWRTLLTLYRGFDRMTLREETRGDGRQVIIKIADLDGSVGTVIRTKDLHVELDNDILAIDTVPQVAPNEAQVYVLTCKVRTLRNKFFETRR